MIIRARDLTPGQQFRFEDGPILTTISVCTHSHPSTGHSVGVYTIEQAELLYLDYSDQVTLVKEAHVRPASSP